MVTFPTNISCKVKKCKFVSHLQVAVIRENNVYMLLIVLQNVVTMLSNFHDVFVLFLFFCWFLLNYTDFAHATSQTKYQYDISGIKNLYMFEKKLRDENVDQNNQN